MVWILYGRLKILSSWVLAWFACFQIFGHSNKWTKAGIKYCKYCECCEILPPIGDNFLSTSFHLYCAAGGGELKSKCIEWMGVWGIVGGSPSGLVLVQPWRTFFSEYSQPQPFTTASMVIYGNPCGMQDGNSIFIENYQTEDLGASIHRSKPSLHLLDSFRLKIHHKTFEKFWETVFSLNAKRPTGAAASEVETAILNCQLNFLFLI